MSLLRDGTTIKDRATQLLICEPLSFANIITGNLSQNMLITYVTKKKFLSRGSKTKH